MAQDLERLIVSLEVRIDQANKNLDAFTRQFDKQAGVIERRQQQMMAKLKNGGADLAKALVPALGVGSAIGLFHYVEQAVEKLNAIGETAERIGMTAEQLQEVDFAASHAGISVEAANEGLQRYVKSAAMAAAGSKPLIASFGALGVTLNDLRTKSPYDLLRKTADGLKNIDDPAQRLRLTLELFGKSGAPWVDVLKDGSAGLDAAANSAKRLGIIFDNSMVAEGMRAKAVMNDLKSVLDVQGTVIAAKLAPAIADLMNKLVKLVSFITAHPNVLHFLEGAAAGGAVGSFVPGVGTGIGAVVGGVATLVTAGSELDKINAKIAAAQAAIDKLNNGDYSGLARGKSSVSPAAALRTAQYQLAALTAMKAAMEKATASAPAAPVAARAKFDPALATLGTSTAYDKAVEQITKQTAVLEGQAGALDRTTASTEAAAAKERLLAAAKLQGIAVTKSLTADIDRLSAAYGNAAGAAGAQKVLDAGDKQIDQLKTELGTLGLTKAQADARAFKENEINAILRERGLITPEETAKIDEQAAAVELYSQKIDDATRALQDQISLQDQARSGLIQIGASGITAFDGIGDAAKQLKDQLIQTILQLYVMKPLVESLLGRQGTGEGGLIGSLAGSLFGAGGGGGATGLNYSGATMATFARGGVADRPSIFGEGGPEAAVPLPDGRSIPVNLRMPRMPSIPAGAGGGNVNVSVQTINNAPGTKVDTQTSRGPDGRVLVQQVISAVKEDMGRGGFDGVMRGRFGAAPSKIFR